MKEKERKARVAVCILLIAWNPSGESESLPSDQPPASLTLSLRRRRRRRQTAKGGGHISFTKTICGIQYIYCNSGGDV